ncbi:hypothetical protein ACLB1R_31920 [Escherichia coli]
MAAHTIAEVKERFAELNIAGAKILTVPELESNPQYVARESITQCGYVWMVAPAS